MFTQLAEEFLSAVELAGIDEAKTVFKELHRLRKQKDTRQVLNACGIYEQRLKSSETRNTTRSESEHKSQSCSTPVRLAQRIPEAVALYEQNKLLDQATTRLIEGSELSDILNLVTEQM